MFHSAAVKLTFWYLGIIMAISIIFSAALYHVYSDDLIHNVNRQIGYFNNFLGPSDFSEYRQLRQKQLDQDIGDLRASLILFNLVVLVGGGAGSYLLARRTLSPIEQALEFQTRFTADASHELRTPLAAIQTENEVALRDKNLTKTGAVKLIKSNLEEVAKLNLLAESLLRLSSPKLQPEERQTVPLKQASAAAVSQLTKPAAAKRVKIDNQVGAETAYTQPDSLTELLAILLDNAIKYSSAGQTVKLTSRRRDKAVLLSVTDTGRGIKPDELPRIFERFYRADSSRSRSGPGGYGLGLAIAERLARQQGGFIEVKSVYGQGSTFTIQLPRA